MKYWRQLILAVFVLLIFEGALRKWVFPSAQAVVYLVKDGLLLVAYGGFLLDARSRHRTLVELNSLKMLLVCSFAFGVLEIFNPASPSILVGLVGLKNYFLYAPLLFILPYVFTSQEHLLNSIKRYLILAIPIAMLGFVQSKLGPESSLNVYVGASETAALDKFGSDYDLVRTTGTFSYISGYIAYLSFIAFLCLGYNLARGWRIKNNVVGILCLTLVVGAMFTTGSRAPIYILIICGPIILAWASASKILPLGTAARLLVLLPVMGAVSLSIFPRAFEAFLERVNAVGSDDTSGRLSDIVLQTIEALSNGPIFGYGIGTFHPSSLTVMGVNWPWWLGSQWFEVEAARVTGELGLIGLVLVYTYRSLIAIRAVQLVRSFKDPVFRSFGIPLAIYLMVSLAFPIIFDATSGLFYWGAAGLMVAMRRFEVEGRKIAMGVPARAAASMVHAN